MGGSYWVSFVFFDDEPGSADFFDDEPGSVDFFNVEPGSAGFFGGDLNPARGALSSSCLLQ